LTAKDKEPRSADSAGKTVSTADAARAGHREQATLASVHARESRLLAQRQQLTTTLAELEAENAQLLLLRERLAVAEEELERAARLERIHQDILNSLSWRLTRPLRWGIASVRSLRGRR
jgi:K+-sensing histidine kinase KdpD